MALASVERRHRHAVKVRRLTLTDGRALQIREWPGSGRPLVLLHGLLASSADWNELARSVPHRCLAIDLPGFGASDPPRRPRLSAYAEDVIEALEQVGVGSMTLVGHSLGGGVATAVAERMGDRVHALVLLAPAGYGRIPMAELGALPLVRTVAVRTLPHLVRRPVVLNSFYALLVTSGIGPTERLRRQVIADASRVGPGLRTAIEALAAAGRSRRAFHRRAVGYDGPVSAVWGERDALVSPTHARGVLDALPQAEVHLWRGMGHHPQRERPAALAALVEASHRTVTTELGCERVPLSLGNVEARGRSEHPAAPRFGWASHGRAAA